MKNRAEHTDEDKVYLYLFHLPYSRESFPYYPVFLIPMIQNFFSLYTYNMFFIYLVFFRRI